MEEKFSDYKEFYDFVIQDSLIQISKDELEKCKKENKVPSKELLDTINTLINFHNSFFKN